MKQPFRPATMVIPERLFYDEWRMKNRTLSKPQLTQSLLVSALLTLFLFAITASVPVSHWEADCGPPSKTPCYADQIGSTTSYGFPWVAFTKYVGGFTGGGIRFERGLFANLALYFILSFFLSIGFSVRNKESSQEKYLMRVVEGALLDPQIFHRFPHRVLQPLRPQNWGRLIEVELSLEEIRKLQKQMVKHYEDPTPWYMDGWLLQDKNRVICAFGADDGEDGKIFTFDRHDQPAFQRVINYALSKGIPKEQMDFLEV